MSRYPPFAVPAAFAAIPSIGEFLDDLPSIADFLAVDVSSGAGEREVQPQHPSIDEFGPNEYDTDGWAISSWQSFDWSSLGSLVRRSDQAAAEASWTGTEWAPKDGGVYGPAEAVYEFSDSATSAHEVAAALNDIANRIRSGELSIDRLDGIPPEAAIAAAFAALLRMRG